MIGVGDLSSQVVDVSSSMGSFCGSVAFIHLGVLVCQNMNWVNAWSFIIDRFCSRLATWKAKCLSFGGRLTMIKSVLGSVGSYFMSIFPTPVIDLRALESLRARFFLLDKFG